MKYSIGDSANAQQTGYTPVSDEAPLPVSQSGAGTPTPIASGTADAVGLAPTANLRLVGFAVRENAGTPGAAEFIIRHGTGATDPLLIPVKLAAGESRADWFGPDGIACAGGLYIDRVSGTTEITLFTKVAA